MKRLILSLLLVACGVALSGTPTTAKIKAITLEGMCRMMDDAVVGTIVHSHSFRVDHPVDGPELYYTTLTVAGRSLVNGQEKTTDVTFLGGFIDETNGTFNSESPSMQETQIGNEVVVFHMWSDNIGGDVACNVLIGGHGGLFPVVNNREGQKVVLGRGAGYPVSSNVPLNDLDRNITKILNR